MSGPGSRWGRSKLGVQGSTLCPGRAGGLSRRESSRKGQYLTEGRGDPEDIPKLCGHMGFSQDIDEKRPAVHTAAVATRGQ